MISVEKVDGENGNWLTVVYLHCVVVLSLGEGWCLNVFLICEATITRSQGQQKQR